MSLKILTFIAIVLITVTARGDVFDSETEKLMGARSSAEILRVTSEISRLKIARAGCEAQDRSDVVPYSCIQAVRLETQQGFLSREEAKAKLARLDRRCVEKAEQAKSLRLLDLALSQPNLPAGCRKALASRRDELKYITDAGS